MKEALSLFNAAGRKRALKRFGYEPSPSGDRPEDFMHEWGLLAPGIHPALADVPLNQLSETKQALAVQRVRNRRALDRMMEECDEAHARIAEGGADPTLIEAYTILRDRFEDAVEEFLASGSELAITMLQPED